MACEILGNLLNFKVNFDNVLHYVKLNVLYISGKYIF